MDRRVQGAEESEGPLLMDRSKLKWIAIGAAALGILLLAVVAMLLTREYDSRGLGEALLARVNGEDLQIAAEGFKFHPLSGLEMSGVTMTSAIPDGAMTAQVEKITVTHRLRPLLTGRVVFDEIVLEKPDMQVVWSTAPVAVPPSTGGGASRDPSEPATNEPTTADEGAAPTLAITRFAMVDGTFDMRDEGAEVPTVAMENFGVELRDFAVGSGGGGFLEQLTSHGDLRAERMVTPVAEATNARGKIKLQDAHVLLTDLRLPMPAGDMVFEQIDVDLGSDPFTYQVAGAGSDLRTHVLFGAKSGFGAARLDLEMAGEGTATGTATGGGRLAVDAGKLGELPVLADIEKLVAGSNLVGRPYEAFEIRFRLGEDRLEIEPFEIVSGETRLGFGGIVSLDGGIDMSTVFNLPRQGLEIKQIPEEVLEAFTDTDGRIKLPIAVDGTAEAPDVKFDQSAWGELVKRRAAKEVEKELTKALGRLFAGDDSSEKKNR